MTIRVGPVISAAAHGAALLGVLLILGQPTQFETTPPDSIAVDIVTPEEVEPKQAKPPEPEKSLAESSGSTAASAESSAAAQPQASSPLTEPAQSSSSQQASAAPPAPQPLPNLFLPPPGAVDLADLLMPYNLNLAKSGFDARAQSKADLTADEVTQFKTRLRQCWRLPDGVAASSATRIVLRVALAQSGSLTAEPELVEASAAPDGPFVMQAAVQALQQCQPYTFLPRDRYREWKEMDVSFTPREMAGG